MNRELRILLLAFVLIVGPAVILTGLASRVITHWRVIRKTQLEGVASRALDQAAASTGADVMSVCDSLRKTVARGWGGAAGRWAAVAQAAAGFRFVAPWCRDVYVLSPMGKVAYPPPILEAPYDAAAAGPERPIYRLSAAAEALSLHFVRTNDAAAAREYVKALAQPGLPPVATAQLHLWAAACLRRLGRLKEAEFELRQVATGSGAGGPVCDTDEGFHLDLTAQQSLVDVLDEAGEPARALDELQALAAGVNARYPRIPAGQRAVLTRFLDRRGPALLRVMPGSGPTQRWAQVTGLLAEWRRAGTPGDARREALATGFAMWRAATPGEAWRWIGVSLDDVFLMCPGPEGTVLAVAVDAARMHTELDEAARRSAPMAIRFGVLSSFVTNDAPGEISLVLAESRLAPPLGAFTLSARPADEADFEASARLTTRLYAWGAGVLAVAIVAGGILLWRISATEIRSARQRSEFAAAVSHDLRTPLSSMRMLAESLHLGRITEEAKRQRFLATIVNECDRLGRLTERALYFIRLGQGALRYRLTEGDLGALIRETVETYAAAGVDRERHLRVRVAAQLPAVRFDGGAMEQVVSNLLDNADKYSPEHKDVLVSVEASADGRWVVLAVQDRGIGIPPEDLRRIFQPYYRGERAKASDASGVGLGLALCRHIVRAHGGRIEVESVVGEGSTFRVVLPAA